MVCGQRLAAEVRQRHGVVKAEETAADRLHLGPAVDVARPVAISVDDQQHLRIDLTEAIEHRLHSELRCTTGPDGAEACGRQEGDDRLRHVGQICGDAISGADTETLQPASRSADLISELVPRERRRWARLRMGDDRRPLAVMAKDLFGVVQASADEPLAAGHLGRVDHLAVRHAGLHVEELPHGSPETGGVIDRPPPQFLVGRERSDAAFGEPRDEMAEVGAGNRLGRRSPQDLG